MSKIIVDSGVLIASVFLETLTPQAKGLLHQLQAATVEFHAPMLLRYEVVAVARKAVYQGRITTDIGRGARDQLLTYPVSLHIDDVLLKRAYELAELHNRPTAYDSQYLALAERLKCDFWTADERLFNALNGAFSTMRYLGNWVAPHSDQD